MEMFFRHREFEVCRSLIQYIFWAAVIYSYKLNDIWILIK